MSCRAAPFGSGPSIERNNIGARPRLINVLSCYAVIKRFCGSADSRRSVVQPVKSSVRSAVRNLRHSAAVSRKPDHRNRPLRTSRDRLGVVRSAVCRARLCGQLTHVWSAVLAV